MPTITEKRELASKNPTAFWAKEAEMLFWHKRWDKVRDFSFNHKDLHIKWFDGGMLNVAENCLDRHLKDKANKPAIIWEPDSPDAPGRILTYQELHKEVVVFANALLSLGLKEGDVATIYMPMVPEAAIAMLACARVGIIHSVVFAGFSAGALNNRIVDCKSKIVITADGGRRGGKLNEYKKSVDEAIKNTSVEKLVILKHLDNDITWNENTDVWWHELKETVRDKDQIKMFPSEQPLFILYTSGSTGKPKGLLHTSAGYLLYATHTFMNVFDYKENDVYWCTADVGWITGHSYIVYGPLCAGATTLMFEGVPTFPDASRVWQIVDKYKVTKFYTAPTTIRMLMREGDSFVKSTNRKSLNVLGSVGEPINPEAWHWYNEIVGENNCNIVDTWWQTETGGHIITPIPGQSETPPGSATLPYFGISVELLDEKASKVAENETGALCIKESWPGQARTIWGDHERFFETYFATYPGYYFSGDCAHRDEKGNYWIEGRMDDVIKVAGHRLGTAEIEAAINEHEAIVESAVVGVPDEIKGNVIYAFVILKPEKIVTESTPNDINQIIRKVLGPIAVVKTFQFVPGLPKTRSGKIMRRILRKIAEGEIKSKDDYSKLGDTSTLLNPEIIDDLVKGFNK